MTELRSPALDWYSALPESVESGIEANASESHDYTHAWKKAQLCKKEGATVGNLLGKQLVRGGSAATGSCDIAVFEFHAVVADNRMRLTGKSCFVQGAEKPIAAPVSREHPSCAVPSMSSRRKADKEKSGSRVAKTRNGLSPIVAIRKPSCLHPCDVFSPAHESGAPAAPDDLSMNRFKP